ncbi:hypothetical protein WV31_06415 [Magnetospirillum sp. ME-1]|uniref:hypothetical protein n=1 Tax=Magnetospirillum sp. ME-1 TaxID=1639348 RepID=UPI000A17EFC7|nr:hypothetical protein [Magnetospirillum sp. ME-1]ARJ65309.1 hypothetical protein WV31_06415 [Magnetospirillum sp. ME-1]
MTQLSVSKCDNELYVIAIPVSPNGGTAAVEVLHISSGYNDPVNYSINLGSVLVPGGTYSITMMGINWGGPAAFAVNLNGTPYTFSDGSGKLGLVWNQSVNVTVNR